MLGSRAAATRQDQEGTNTNHFVVSDRWGDVVSYTNTIEQIGGSGIVVPGRGFLLNNELTDFNFAPTQGTAPDPNLPAAGKRPRSSMSPTIALRDGRPFVAVGAAGGATIITTVLGILVNRIDFGMTLPDAIAAPRASQRNSATTQAEPDFIAQPTTPGLEALGQKFAITDTSPLDPTIKIAADDRRRDRARGAPRRTVARRSRADPPRRRVGRRRPREAAATTVSSRLRV